MYHLGTCLIETNRLYMRRFRSSDSEDCLLNWLSDEAVFQFISQSEMGGAR